MKCDNCDRPLATKQDARDFAPGEGGHLCWGACEPEDWRARALTAERERDEARAEVSRCHSDLRIADNVLMDTRRARDEALAEVLRLREDRKVRP